MKSKRKLVRFIINPAAAGEGSEERLSAAVKEVFTSVPGLFEIRTVQQRGEARKLAAEAVTKGYGFVFACGDDSVVKEVASALVNSGTVLGIIPPTPAAASPLCAALGTPERMENAMRLLLEGEIRNIDVGVVAGRHFLASADMGFDAHTALVRGPGTKITRRMAGSAALLLRLLRYRAQPVTIRTEERIWTVRPFVLRFVNTAQFDDTLRIRPKPWADDGLIDACVVPWPGLRDRIRFFFNAALDKGPTLTAIKPERAPSFEVIRKKPGPVRADGEHFFGGKTLKVRVLAGALKVLAVKRTTPA